MLLVILFISISKYCIYYQTIAIILKSIMYCPNILRDFILYFKLKLIKWKSIKEFGKHFIEMYFELQNN